MATPNPLTKVYVGDEAAGFVSASLLSGETLGKGNVTVLPNVAYQVNLKNLNFAAGSVADATCDFTDGSAISYKEQTITPKRFQLQKELCKNDWLSTYAGAQMTAGVDGTIPSSFAEYLISHAGAYVGKEVETAIWSGTDTGGSFQGFVSKLAADTDVADATVTSGVTALSADNIIAELGALRDAIPSSVYGNEDLCIYLGSKAMRYYISAQSNLGYMDKYHAGVTDSNFEGIKLCLANGMADNTMVAARKSNMFFATDLTSDLTEVKVIDMTETNGSDNVRLIMKYNAGVGYANGGDIALYQIS